MEGEKGEGEAVTRTKEGSRGEMMRLECERAVEKIKTGLNVSDGSGN